MYTPYDDAMKRSPAAHTPELPTSLPFPGKYGNTYRTMTRAAQLLLRLQDVGFPTSFIIKILHAFLVPMSELYTHRL
jgi:hypothetical protein